jgi:preprotein translocase subunit SecB
MTKKQSLPVNMTIAAPDIGDLANQSVLLRDLRLLKSGAMASLNDAIPELEQTIAVKTSQCESPLMLATQVTLSLVGKYSDDREGLRIEATYGLAYQVDTLDGITNEHIKAFGQFIAVSDLWPYWREFVQSTVGRMGLPPLVLPLVRPGTIHQGSHEAQRQQQPKGKPVRVRKKRRT